MTQVAYRDVVLADNPAGYWRLNEAAGPSAADATGKGHTGTYTGTIFYSQQGPLLETGDYSLFLNGSGAVTIGTAADLNTGAGPMTIEAWILQGTGVTGPIIEYGNAADWGPHLWVFPTAADLWYNPAEVAGISPGLAGVGVLGALWVWHHVVAVYTGSLTYLYCDGKQITSASCSGPVKGPYPPNIGFRAMSPGTYYVGRIDEVAIYNSALSPARVQAHFAAGEPYMAAVLADVPIGYWRLGEQQGATTAYDQSGYGRHGTYTGGVTIGQPALQARDADPSALFDGTSGYVAVPGTGVNIMGTGPGTLEAWVRLDAGYSGNPRVIAYGGNMAWQMFVSGGSRNLCVFLFNGGVFDTGIPLVLGQRYHVCASISAQGAGNITIFVNGVQRISVPNTGGTNSPAGYNLQIGQSGNNADYWKGSIDEVAIYNKALTAARVDAHYRAGRAQPQRWDGTAWVPFAPQRWDGSQWVETTPRRWDATANTWT